VQPSPPRPIESVWESQRTLEGAGVRVRRAFGSTVVPRLDPFLLLDDLRSENPMEFAAGFPWHPHRGIQTVTYMLEGRVDHGDSLGNAGAIGPGDVQWMTAGSGIIHQEMPKGVGGRMGGFQLWLNLPRAHKMMHPLYQEIKQAAIPLVEPSAGVRARIIAGDVHGVKGPVHDGTIDPLFLDVELAKGAVFDQPLPPGHRAFAYTLAGQGRFYEGEAEIAPNHLVVFGEGGNVRVEAPRSAGARFLLAAGKPLREPVAWWGPIVMNHRRELEEAIQEFQAGTFIKHRARVDVPG
jgi:quercetin 2,3-dioxygenase